ncbi:septum formation protein [Bacillus oleivorans]|uniref:dTTP/UTP pyrophosphatase n=1 Tax=Bacillus oleivorans TaxID=1448271 RepID=A0A285CWW2_9BACI|nr:Maf family protein [Bacillus oleivorans]SNX71558.1 septum formation protein [Bacillus oleivorans]
MKPLILASGSPRRSELLKQMNIPFEIHKSGVSEDLPPQIYPQDAVIELSSRKALDVAAKFPDYFVLGADTVVSIQNEILGKPHNQDEAISMLKKLSAATHQVYTGVTIVAEGSVHSFYDVTDVTFWELSEQDINTYIESREPFDKAGGYGIQGKGAYLVKEIKGDYYSVMGLPLSKTIRALKKCGFPV